MKLSIIITVLNSHEILRRQFLYWSRMDLPDGVEFLIIDDGSDPPLEYPSHGVKNLTIYQTHDTRPWTITLARNYGVTICEGEYIILTDIDHILPRESIMDAYNFTGDRMMFRRYFGFLDEVGEFSQDIPTLISYGVDPERLRRKGLGAGFHGDSFIMRKEQFWKAGGYSPDDIIKYPPMGETHFRNAYRELSSRGEATTDEHRPLIYLIPNGQYAGDVDANPFELFHNLSRVRNKYAYMLD